MKMVFKIILSIVVLVVIGLTILIVYATITKYRPQEKELLFYDKKPAILSGKAKLSLLTWNVGYGGLGEDMDFFYDGGSKTRTSYEQTLINYNKILSYLYQNKHKDFILLQEVDKKARRSYNINMYDSLQNKMEDFIFVYGKNYNVRFVPLPIYKPMGHVNSGIVTISNHNPFISERHSYPGSYSWPTNLFNLERCFTLNRYQVDNGRELVIINTHNSAFDDGNLRKKQMEHLKTVLTKEYNKGNYVIAGGDWNQCPPGFKPDFFFNDFDTVDLMYISENYLPKWQWAYDNTVPTNRRLSKPYDPAKSLTTVIDFFLVSPNIKIIDVRGIHLDFKHSDHNPVKLEVQLLGDNTINNIIALGD